MERNTRTTISELKKGDRFYFPADKKKIVYEIVCTTAPRGFYYNRINAYGYKMLTHDVWVSTEKEAIFLRHKNGI